MSGPWGGLACRSLVDDRQSEGDHRLDGALVRAARQRRRRFVGMGRSSWPARVDEVGVVRARASGEGLPWTIMDAAMGHVANSACASRMEG